MTNRARPLAVALTAVAAAGLAACSPSSSASAPASPASVAAAKAPASSASTVTPQAACGALAYWESNGSGNITTDTALQETFRDTTQPLSREFATWVSAAKDNPSAVSADGALVSLECTTYGVTVFPSDSDSAAPPAPASAAAPADTGPAGTASQMQALAAAESYLGDGQGFSRQGLIDQLDSSYGNSFSVADATWAVDHSDANWDDQAVDCAKGYMSDGQGFSRQGLIDQMTSAYGNKFTLAQATYAANAVGL